MFIVVKSFLLYFSSKYQVLKKKKQRTSKENKIQECKSFSWSSNKKKRFSSFAQRRQAKKKRNKKKTKKIRSCSRIEEENKCFSNKEKSGMKILITKSKRVLDTYVHKNTKVLLTSFFYPELRVLAQNKHCFCCEKLFVVLFLKISSVEKNKEHLKKTKLNRANQGISWENPRKFMENRRNSNS